jgi:hypothetical protein
VCGSTISALPCEPRCDIHTEQISCDDQNQNQSIRPFALPPAMLFSFMHGMTKQRLNPPLALQSSSCSTIHQFHNEQISLKISLILFAQPRRTTQRSSLSHRNAYSFRLDIRPCSFKPLGALAAFPYLCLLFHLGRPVHLDPRGYRRLACRPGLLLHQTERRQYPW